MIVKLKISDIVIPQGLLPRVLTGTVQEVVERYKEAMEAGEQFPPIKVWKRENGYWLIDGVHRLQAHKLLGREYIEAELVECKDELDFRIRAITENIKHGLALSSEEIKENARLLYRAGLKDVKEIAKILKRTERAVYYYLEDLIEEERQNLRKQILQLRDSGLKIREIAEKTGLSERWVKQILSEGEEIEKISKTSLSLPPTKEAIKLFSEFLEVIDVETKGLAEKWQAFLSARMAERGFEIEGDPVKFLASLIDETRDVIKRFGDAEWSVVEKAVESISWVKELSAVARKNWIGRSRKYWESIKEELERKRQLETLILQRAEEVLRDHTYIFSNWNNLAHHLRSTYQDFTQITESKIRDVLIKHSDSLIAIYEEIPELTEEEWEQIADRKMNYDEAVEIARVHNKRLPYAVWQVWHSKQEALSPSTSPPSSGLASSQPALSNIQVSDDDWADWNDENDDEVREKEKKQEKKEVKLVPPEEELERLAGDIYRIVAIIMERYSIEVIEEWWEEIEKEVREAIEIRRKREGK